MAHIARSVEVDAPVDVIHQQWLRFEELPRCAVHAVVAHVRWRAEVLTFEPISAGTRITLRIDYDPSGGDPGLTRRLDAALQSFLAFFDRCRGRAFALQPA